MISINTFSQTSIIRTVEFAHVLVAFFRQGRKGKKSLSWKDIQSNWGVLIVKHRKEGLYKSVDFKMISSKSWLVLSLPDSSRKFSTSFSSFSPTFFLPFSPPKGTYIREVRVFFNTDHLQCWPQRKWMEENPRTPRKNGDSFTKETRKVHFKSDKWCFFLEPENRKLKSWSLFVSQRFGGMLLVEFHLVGSCFRLHVDLPNLWRWWKKFIHGHLNVYSSWLFKLPEKKMEKTHHLSLHPKFGSVSPCRWIQDIQPI